MHVPAILLVLVGFVMLMTIIGITTATFLKGNK